MSALSNKSSSHYMCAEATLPFSAVAQRFKIGEEIMWAVLEGIWNGLIQIAGFWMDHLIFIK